MPTLRRIIHPEVRVLDEKTGIVEYIASDESLDHYREIIKASGWKFTHFQKNAPFVDSHDYTTLEKLVGGVLGWKFDGKKLVETVQWAIDVEENKLAKLGFRMTQAGYLKAVSVGFFPTKAVSRWDSEKDWQSAVTELALTAETAASVRVIYLEQEQVELSACILGANPNALAKAYKADVLDDSDLDFLCAKRAQPISTPGHSSDQTAREADPAAAAKRAQEQRQSEETLWRKVEQQIKGITK